MRRPTARIGTGLVEQRHRQSVEQIRAFGHADELLGTEQPAPRMVPSRQALESRPVSIAEACDRLKIRNELLLGDTSAQFDLKPGRRARGRVHRRIEYAHRVSTGRLGLVHRAVGHPQQLGGIGRGTAIDRNPD